MKKRSPVWLSMVLIGILLVVFPLGSFLYLKAGISYRVESLGELKPLGSADVFGLEKSTDEKPIVYLLYTTPSSEQDSVVTTIRNIHEAFTHEPAVMFAGMGESSFTILEDREQSVQLNSSKALQDAFREMTNASQFCEGVPIKQQGILIDTEGLVRRCYDLHSGPDATRLVEHLTILVPPAPIEDMILEREKEY